MRELDPYIQALIASSSFEEAQQRMLRAHIAEVEADRLKHELLLVHPMNPEFGEAVQQHVDELDSQLRALRTQLAALQTPQ